jgi:hypothetical protein
MKFAVRTRAPQGWRKLAGLGGDHTFIGLRVIVALSAMPVFETASKSGKRM